ncbi:MAG: hypothetical protein GEU74_11855 [Nitriliruptorales bacterium]|nr:hypothetical protein [Nitriliruptorales bacterium]
MKDGWEGGERQGIRWLRVAGVLAVAVVSALLWFQRDRGISVERDGQPVGGPTAMPQVVVTAPLRAGDRWYCSSDYPVRAYAADAVYYPPHYPTRGAFVARPDECYVDEERAAAAGYQLADPPPGSVVAGDVYVVVASAPGRAACAQLAVEAQVAVPCPTVLPSPATGPSCTDNRCRMDDGIVIEQRGFDAPPLFCVDCDHHVMITAVKDNESRHLVTCPEPPAQGEDPGSVTAVPQDEGLDRVGPTPEVLECAQGPPWIPGIGGIPHEGHTMARWRTGGHTFGVSVEGHGERQTQLLHALLNGIEICAARPQVASGCRPVSG